MPLISSCTKRFKIETYSSENRRFINGFGRRNLKIDRLFAKTTIVNFHLKPK